MYCAASHPTIPTVTPTHPETSGPTPLHPTVSQPPLTQNLHNLILLSLPNPEPHCPLWRDPLTLGPIRPSFPGAPAWPGTPGSPWRREDISQFLAHPSAPHSGGAPHSPALLCVLPALGGPGEGASQWGGVLGIMVDSGSLAGRPQELKVVAMGPAGSWGLSWGG